MAGSLNYYGYSDKGTQIVSVKSQEEAKQSQVDAEQDVLIKKSLDDNITQQDEIDRNSMINDQQVQQIDDLYNLIEDITSGGTITDLDMGDW